jgi:hypothetical protein
MGKFDVKSQERKPDGHLSKWVVDDRGIEIFRIVNLPGVKDVVIRFEDGSSRRFRKVDEKPRIPVSEAPSIVCSECDTRWFETAPESSSLYGVCPVCCHKNKKAD